MRQSAAAACMMAALLLLAPSASAAKKVKPPENEPDYTQGAKPHRTDIPWNLGPTGLKGNLWGKSGGNPTRDTRMIHIQSVAENSPASGLIEPDDVILGVISPHPDGPKTPDAKFTDNVRFVMANAITLAETKEHQGKLVLNIWRKGKTMPVTLKLDTKGSYSKTAPYDCEKTKTLIEDAAQAIIRDGFFKTKSDGSEADPKGGIDSYLDALGLLATANPEYLPAIQKYARAVAKGSEKLDIFGGEGCHLGTWHAGYRNLFLTEYFLATKDQEVLAGIKALSTYISLGQSGVGTWSHGMAAVSVNGLYGPPSAYGAMNSASVPCVISLMLAQKCGIKEEPIDQAVIRSLDFYRWFMDKGIPPYGDHDPKLSHDNNGKGSMTAVMFDIAGEEEPARYFTRCTLASHKVREGGHTGNFFSKTWGPPGAARGGPLAAQAFTRNTQWMTELGRQHDGGGRYQYQIPNDTKKYANWSTAGIRLLEHCMPLKAIHLTGKGGCLSPMSAEEVQNCVAAATYDPTKRTVAELLEDLGSWSPVLREQAAAELGMRDEDVSQQLITMLNGPDRYARYGAARGLWHAGRESEKAVDALVEKLADADDLTMRYYAVQSLKVNNKRAMVNGLGKAVKKASDALFKQAATYEPKKDPMRKLHNLISGALFYSGRTQDYRGYYGKGQGLETVDRKLLIPALKSILANPNGGARSAASSIFEVLSEEDLEQLYGDIYVATKNRPPSGVMFSNTIRNNGAILLSEKKFEEALPLALDLYFQEGWGAWTRTPAAMKALTNFGSKLKPHMDKITEAYIPFSKRGGINKEKVHQIWSDLKASLEEDVKLQSIKPYLEAGGFDPSILE